MKKLTVWAGAAALATQVAWVSPLLAAREMTATADSATETETQAYASKRLQTWRNGWRA